LSTNAAFNNSATSFITRWKAFGASERANYQLFLTELCELLGVEKPRPASDKVHEADYTFERSVEFNDGEGKTCIVKTGIRSPCDHSSIHNPITAADISRQFAGGKKAANVAREQQVVHLLETIFTLVLVRKTGGGCLCDRGRLIYLTSKLGNMIHYHFIFPYFRHIIKILTT
jgi:hypothetical protein